MIDQRALTMQGQLPAHGDYEGLHPEQLDYAEDSDQELNPKTLREPEKIAVHQSIVRVIGRIVLYLLPVGLSFAILQLSFRHIYWRGTGSSGSRLLRGYSINQVLNILQIVAKVHEILIVLSLSHLILHYLRQHLLSTNGVSFGLLTSAYQVTLGGAPFSKGFWNTCRSLTRRRTFNKRALSLVCLLLLATALGLTVGPASAIAVLPRLDWWDQKDLFTFFTAPDKPESNFKLYIPKQLFPDTLDSTNLPGSYCLDSSLDLNASCPFAGYSSLLESFTLTESLQDNYTLTESTGLNRRMATETYIDNFSAVDGANTTTLGRTKSWTYSQVLANYMSLGWQSSVASSDPYIVEARLRNISPKSPFVNVTCQMQPSTITNRNLSFFNRPHGYSDSWGALGPDHNGSIDIRNIWNATTLAKSNQTLFEWRELFQETDDPWLAAFILSPSLQKGKPSNITMCGVKALYDQTSMWIMSSGSPTISSNFTFETTETIDNRIINKAFPVIRVHKSWADSLNAPATNSSTVMTDFIDKAMRKYPQASADSPVLAQSKILSMAVADGIARVGAEHNVNNGADLSNGCYAYNVTGKNVTLCRNGWCGQGRFVDDCAGPAILNGTTEDFLVYYHSLSVEPIAGVEGNLLRSFPAPADIDTSWTEISFPKKRYGYGWGFDTVAIKVATVILALHTLVILIHCVVLLYTGITYSFLGSLADLVALAFASHTPKALQAASVGIFCGSTMSQPTAVRQIGGTEYDNGKLAFVVGEDLQEGNAQGLTQRVPVAGKHYG